MRKELSYRDAGVDIDAADRILDSLRETIMSTWTSRTVTELGGFAAAYQPPWEAYRRPHLVACTDGVGTKLKLAGQLEAYRGVGVDCVAMVVNDLVTGGARPLFFLDYIAAAKLEPKPIQALVEGLVEGCREAECALIGGETAEMPGVYQLGDHEIVGFAVGILEGDPGAKPRRIQPDDVAIGLASSGPHSNGYSLIRRIVEECGWHLTEPLDGLDETLGEALLRPTRIYVRPVRALFKKGWALACAHITGGGLMANISRVVPEGLQLQVDWSSWQVPPIFDVLADAGNVSVEEMRRTFNLGVGMVVIVPPETTNDALSLLDDLGYSAWLLGRVKDDGS